MVKVLKFVVILLAIFGMVLFVNGISAAQDDGGDSGDAGDIGDSGDAGDFGEAEDYGDDEAESAEEYSEEGYVEYESAPAATGGVSGTATSTIVHTHSSRYYGPSTVDAAIAGGIMGASVGGSAVERSPGSGKSIATSQTSGKTGSGQSGTLSKTTTAYSADTKKVTHKNKTGNNESKR